MRMIHSMSIRFLVSHLLVAVLNAVVLAIFVFANFAMDGAPTDVMDGAPNNARETVAAIWAESIATAWFIPTTDSEPSANMGGFGSDRDFGLVVDPANTVIAAYGSTPCTVGQQMSACLPEAVDQVEEQITTDGWIQYVLNTTTGHRVITRSYSPLIDTLLFLTIQMMLMVLVVTVISLPIAFVLSKLLVRGYLRRLKRVVFVSQRFAAGDWDERVHDQRQDELGKMAQQFDRMAERLQSNILTLRMLTQQLAEARLQGEQVAMQNERIRLARELHDEISQRLFSLTASSSTLPDIIRNDTQRGIALAQTIADSAQQALLDLRGVLASLRPVGVAESSLVTALSQCCEAWQRETSIPVETSFTLQGRPLLPAMEDAVYRITQEALNNIARHALRASQVQVTVLESQKMLRLSISDDGPGFDPALPAEGRHGVIGMKERARALTGTLIIEGDARGTTVTAELPLAQWEPA